MRWASRERDQRGRRGWQPRKRMTCRLPVQYNLRGKKRFESILCACVRIGSEAGRKKRGENDILYNTTSQGKKRFHVNLCACVCAREAKKGEKREATVFLPSREVEALKASGTTPRHGIYTTASQQATTPVDRPSVASKHARYTRRCGVGRGDRRSADFRL